MRENINQLRKELHQAGASAAEINELLSIAFWLSWLNQAQTITAKESDSNRLGRLFKPMIFAASVITFSLLCVTVSHAASPTSFLYPVRKFSDSMAIDIYPHYRATVMMKRAQQVNELVAEHVSSKQVLATLADYTMEASAYKSTPHANYGAFEFCKTNLEQAASSASPAVKKAIASTLLSLEKT
ncbi:MAG TPA: hypothetical protein VGS08_01450 [Candidatus Saccharimonadales bacterium]|nr:hypothetical protein [Candidatus Saccharimonadales bacterium]